MSRGFIARLKQYIAHRSVFDISRQVCLFIWIVVRFPFNWIRFGNIGKFVRLHPGVDVEGGRNIEIGDFTEIQKGVLLSAWKPGAQIRIGNDCHIHRYVQISAFQGTVKIGQHCSCHQGCILYGHGGLYIGDYVRMAAGVRILAMNHIFDRTDIPIMDQGLICKGITIGNDVWIGTNAIILDGVSVGDGCVIGAGSVVTHSVPPMSVIVGSPARIIRTRGARS